MARALVLPLVFSLTGCVAMGLHPQSVEQVQVPIPCPAAKLLPPCRLPACGELPRPPQFADMNELAAEALVAEVLARNPSLAEMVAAWQAAAARYPQVTSLDDPMLGVQLAPGAWFSKELDGGARLELSQK